MTAILVNMGGFAAACASRQHAYKVISCALLAHAVVCQPSISNDDLLISTDMKAKYNEKNLVFNLNHR